MRIRSLILAVTAGLGVAFVTPVYSAPITGGISFADSFESTGNSNYVVSLLNAIDVIQGAGVASVGGCSGSFGFCAPPPTLFGAAFDFDITLGSQHVFDYGAFSFNFSTFSGITRTLLNCVNGNCSDVLSFTGIGVVDDGPGGLDPTGFTYSWSANGSCTEDLTNPGHCDPLSTPTASWSSSITSTGRPPTVPEPATLALLGIALAGLGFVRRQRQA